jgi:hypothetical protein
MRRQWTQTAEDKVLVAYYSALIRDLPPNMKQELSEYLGLSYYTLMGKVSPRGGFSKDQFDAVVKWFSLFYPEMDKHE